MIIAGNQHYSIITRKIVIIICLIKMEGLHLYNKKEYMSIFESGRELNNSGSDEMSLMDIRDVTKMMKDESIVYKSYLSKSINEVIESMLNGAYYKFMSEEIRDFAEKEHKHVNIVFGFKHIEKDLVGVMVEVFSDFIDIEAVKLRNVGYDCYGMMDMKRIRNRNFRFVIPEYV